MNSPISFAYFGSSRFSVIVLDTLEKRGMLPTLIITTPDKPQGRKLLLTPTEVKVWAQKRNIPVLDPAKLDAAFIASLKQQIETMKIQVFVVASYGKILPKTLISLPPRETLNIHPSLLPKYRGASPLQSAMLDDATQTGVTIMHIDELMDHGPIVAQKEVTVDAWPTYEDFEALMATEGANLLADSIKGWIDGSVKEIEQNHAEATETKKIKKEDGLIDFSDDPYVNFRKIQAYREWPVAFFFVEKNGKQIRVKITSASYKGNSLELEKVIPEGGKEMSFQDFVSGYGPVPGL